MSIKDKINERLKNAMKDKDSELLNVMRSISAKITEAEKKDGKVLSDDEILKVIEKLSKQREESIVLFRQGSRLDLVEKEEFQLNILKEYIPQKFDENKTREIISELFSKGFNNIGSIMKELNSYGNNIDKKIASVIIKEFIKLISSSVKDSIP